MKLKIAKASLLEALQRVQNVVGTRSTLPILANVLITADKGNITLTTTDLEVSVRAMAKADVQKTGATTLPARRLSSIVRELPDKTIQLEVDEKDAATLKCDSSYFKILGITEEDFPPMSMPDSRYSYHMEEATLKEMLSKTAYAASSDETRHVLNGELLSFKGGKLTIVATDGRRLALVEHEVEFPADAETDVILPTKAINELVHTLGVEGEVKILVDETKATFEFGDVFIASKLIEGTYPNFRQVIPNQCEERVAVERESLLTALKRVSLVTTDKGNAAQLVFGKNKIVISTTTVDVGEARETIPVKYAGKEITVAFNPDYMMDPLRNLANDEVFFELTDAMSPGVIKTDSPFLYVLMPMRVT